jgi:type VI protein secretion system component Hcp
MAGALFVKIDGIEADAEDKDHSGYFDAISFGFGGNASVDPTTLLPRAKANSNPFTFSVKQDGNLATVYQYMFTNKDTKVTAHWRMQVKAGKVLGVDMTLEDARIISVNTQLAEEGGNVTSSTTIQVGYGSCTVQFNGEKNAAVETAWNTRAHE